MAAYFIADIDITDSDLYADYRGKVGPILEKYGAKPVVRGGAAEMFEGNWQPGRIVVMEFPDMATLKRWYHSQDYADLLATRLRAANCRAIAVEGV